MLEMLILSEVYSQYAVSWQPLAVLKHVDTLSMLRNKNWMSRPPNNQTKILRILFLLWIQISKIWSE